VRPPLLPLMLCLSLAARAGADVTIQSAPVHIGDDAYAVSPCVSRFPEGLSWTKTFTLSPEEAQTLTTLHALSSDVDATISVRLNGSSVGSFPIVPTSQPRPAR